MGDRTVEEARRVLRLVAEHGRRPEYEHGVLTIPSIERGPPLPGDERRRVVHLPELRAKISQLLDAYESQARLLAKLQDARHAGDAQAALGGLLAICAARRVDVATANDMRDVADAALDIADAMAAERTRRAAEPST